MTDGPLRPVPGPPPGQVPGSPVAAQAGTGAESSLGAVLERLDGMDALATADHLGVLEAVHDALVAELARAED